MRTRYTRLITPILLVATASSAHALSIAPGDILVYQNRNDTLGTANATPVTILDINPTTPALVQSFPISIGQATPLFSTIADPIANLSLSNNNTQLSFPGWTTTGVKPPTGTLGNEQGIPRGAGTLDSAGNYAQPVTYNPAALATPTDQPHAAYSPDGTNWYFGDSSGMYYNNATTPLTNSDATLSIKGFSGSTYALHTLAAPFNTNDADRTSAATVLSKVTPTSPAPGITSITYTPVITLPAAAHDFILASSFNQAPDTLYVATATGISKFGLLSGVWTPEGSTAIAGVTGITALRVPTVGFELFFTIDLGTPIQNLPSTLDELLDPFGPGTAITNTAPTVIYTAPNISVLEGVSIAPTPEPTTALLLLPVALTLTRRRNLSP